MGFVSSGRIAVLIILEAENEVDKKYVVTVQQAPCSVRDVPSCDIPAGVLNNNGSFDGTAAKAVVEVTGLRIFEDEIADMTKLASAKGIYPNLGRSDRQPALFLHTRMVPRQRLNEIRTRLADPQNGHIKVRLVSYENLLKGVVKSTDMLAALTLHEALFRRGYVRV